MTVSDHLSPAYDIWSGHADFPDSPAFYRSVLDLMPTPLLVADADGLVVYGNVALMNLVGRSKTEGLKSSIYDYIHPDDLVSIADAFIMLATSGDEDGSAKQPWAPVRCRILLPDGESMPIEITGFNRLADPDIDGFIYEVRPMRDEEIFTSVIRSGSVGSCAFDPVIEIMTGSNLDVDAAVVLLDGDDTVSLLATNSDELGTALKGSMRSLAQFVAGSFEPEPAPSPIDDLPGSLGARLRSLGYRKAWKLDVASPNPNQRHAILTITSTTHSSTLGVVDRLSLSGDLASVVLLQQWAAASGSAQHAHPNR